MRDHILYLAIAGFIGGVAFRSFFDFGWPFPAFLLLLTAAVFAAAGAVAVGAYVYFTLPDVRPLKTRNPSTTAFMALREQEYRSARGPVPRRRQNWASLRAISPHLIDAVLMAEDTAFYQHDGVDYHEVWESLKVDWREKKLSRGASTITQQLAKNLYLSPERSPLRKLRELLIARRLETELSKSRILELYLNVVEWGRHLYGAEAAAEPVVYVTVGADRVQTFRLLVTSPAGALKTDSTPIRFVLTDLNTDNKAVYDSVLRGPAK